MKKPPDKKLVDGDQVLSILVRTYFQNMSLQFDGIYHSWSPSRQHNEYLRFYRNGVVTKAFINGRGGFQAMGENFEQNLRWSVISELDINEDECPIKGRYRYSGNSIFFELQVRTIARENYQGSIVDRELRLSRDGEPMQSFRFHKGFNARSLSSVSY